MSELTGQTNNMNIGSTSKNVRSKYFTTEHVTDESLSEFQETKNIFKGPKPVLKPSKTRSRKVPKRLKGQKDIPTLLNAKNELLKYNKEFDKFCKQSGVDVDSEQLQLAIALSKSLQTNEASCSQTTETFTSQERIAKIKTTLQEYGFKGIKNVQIVSNKKKRNNKKYRLLEISQEERHQKITAKYTQILFESLDHSVLENNTIVTEDIIPNTLFYIATNLSFEYMKDNSIFYVDNLLEKSTTNGSLLRDWSEIPGRPVSPKFLEANKINLADNPCSQEELDVLLSGSIIEVKGLINNKYNNIMKEKHRNTVIPSLVIDGKETNDNHEIEINESPIKEHKEVNGSQMSTVTQKYRSCSPDIFDDELSIISENRRSTNILSQENRTKLFADDNCMDLTECANAQKCSQNVEKLSQFSENVTKRKSDDFMEITNCIVGSQAILHNDIPDIDLTQSPEQEIIISKDNSIEITVNRSMNSEPDNPKNCTIDKQNDTVIIDNQRNEDSNHATIHSVDLTQNFICENSKNNPVGEGSQITNEEQYQSMDITQSSNSSVDIDDLPEIIVNSQNSLNDTVILNEDIYLEDNGKVKSSIIPQSISKAYIDLTQGSINQSERGARMPKESIHSNNQSFFEEFNYDHSDNSKDIEKANSFTDNNDNIDLTQSSDTSNEDFEPATAVGVQNNSSLGKQGDISIDYDEVLDDLNIHPEKEHLSEIILNKENDFVEIIDEVASTSNVSEASQLCKDDIEIVNTNNDCISNSSQMSEVFEISDKELNYSLHQSRLEIPADNLRISDLHDTTTRTSKSFNSNNLTNMSMNNSYLPEVKIKKTEVNDIKPIETKNNDAISPLKESKEVLLNKTPKNSEFIIKTDEVTPIMDYASMSTPQRNRELNKYGLKPFKRKRAIQILTHIYNQTHPIVKSCADDDQPSPFKRPRPNINDSPTKLSPAKTNHINNHSPKNSSPMKSSYDTNVETPLCNLDNLTSPSKVGSLQTSSNINEVTSPQKVENIKAGRKPKSPKKCLSKSPRKNGSPNMYDELKSSDIMQYEVTNEVPVIRNIECNPDDWVFQKREKAKLHACRVPLHIAFHNYVSSRRGLREAILKYEPINIDVIHKELVAYGYRYDPKELLRFLDKKCITVKTTDNNARNGKR